MAIGESFSAALSDACGARAQAALLFAPGMKLSVREEGAGVGEWTSTLKGGGFGRTQRAQGDAAGSLLLSTVHFFPGPVSRL